MALATCWRKECIFFMEDVLEVSFCSFAIMLYAREGWVLQLHQLVSLVFWLGLENGRRVRKLENQRIMSLRCLFPSSLSASLLYHWLKYCCLEATAPVLSFSYSYVFTWVLANISSPCLLRPGTGPSSHYHEPSVAKSFSSQNSLFHKSSSIRYFFWVYLWFLAITWLIQASCRSGQ